jgi:hypothetical protein
MQNKIYQFKISLKEIEPLIWRRILVPATYSFWDLHVAIQDAMGWLDYHLHLFKIRQKRSHSDIEIGIPNEDRFEDDQEILPGWHIPIADYLDDVGMTCEYEYDFGDGWIHEIVLEGILLREKGQKFPRCIGGERACPPEDCGGTHGYQELLEVIADPENEEYDEMMTWLGGKYNPEEFSPNKVKFDNPHKRWEKAFTDDGKR